MDRPTKKIEVLLGWAARALFSLALAFLLLSLLPIYPHLHLRHDKGGALGIPRFSENPVRKGVLNTWAFNEYVVDPGATGDRYLRVDVELGDYLIVQRAFPNGDKVALRISAEPGVATGLVSFTGDRATEFHTIPDPANAGVRRIEAGIGGGAVEWKIDGLPVGRSEASAEDGRWILVSGIRSSVIRRIGFGADEAGAEIVHPWRTKWILFAPVFGIILAFLVTLAPADNRRAWSIVSVLSAAGAAAFSVPSMAMILGYGLTALGLSLYLVSAWLWWAVRLPTRKRRRPRAAWLVGVAVWLLLVAGFLEKVPSMFDRSTGVRPEESTVDCWAAPLPAVARDKRRSVVLYGTSTANGEGLSDPATQAVAGRLAERWGSSATVTLRAQSGSTLRHLVEWQEREPDKADLVILYTTFNDSMFAGRPLSSIFFSGGIYRLYSDCFHGTPQITRTYPAYRERFEESLRAFVRNGKHGGAHVLLVGELAADQVMYGITDHGIRRYFESMRRVASEESESFHDASRDLMEARDSVLFIDAMHLNALGHCLLAQSIEPVARAILWPDTTTP